jgi:hypothetical protein
MSVLDQAERRRSAREDSLSAISGSAGRNRPVPIGKGPRAAAEGARRRCSIAQDLSAVNA